MQFNQDLADLIGDHGIVTRYKVLQPGSPNSAQTDSNDQQSFVLGLDQLFGRPESGSHYNISQ